MIIKVRNSCQYENEQEYLLFKNKYKIVGKKYSLFQFSLILFQGRQCNECAPGYVGDPYTIGDSCRRQQQGRQQRYISFYGLTVSFIYTFFDRTVT